MKKSFIVIVVLLISAGLYGQSGKENISGQVSFISTQNVYVKFKSTTGIAPGDTLFILDKGQPQPALTVTSLSSTSCVCLAFAGKSFTVAQQIIARVATISKDPGKEGNNASVKEITVPLPVADTSSTKPGATDFKQNIRGSISLNSYSDLLNSGSNNSHRFRYTLSLNASNISDSKVSFETYMSFKHRIGDWQNVKDNVFDALKIYSLALRYDINKTTQIRLGRSITRQISSIGAMDGIQFEKTIRNFAFGAVAGTRPDFTDYGFNPELFQFGAFASYNKKTSSGFTETSVAFMQQMNNAKTDRRFLYLQHSNTLVKNLSLFSTLEADLFQGSTDTLNPEASSSGFSLTGLYVSLNYRPVRALSFSGSYDARKNVIYYETYKAFVDRILENELRQGFRLQSSYRIYRDLLFGVQAGYRFLKSDPHPSKNLYGYLTYNKVPWIGASATLSATLLESGYLNGNIYSLNLLRDFLRGKVQAGVGYRYVEYTFPENPEKLLQNIGEANLSWQILAKMSFSINYEGTFENDYRYDRIYFQIRKRF
jgi:hypothetical protein